MENIRKHLEKFDFYGLKKQFFLARSLALNLFLFI